MITFDLFRRMFVGSPRARHAGRREFLGQLALTCAAPKIILNSLGTAAAPSHSIWNIDWSDIVIGVGGVREFTGCSLTHASFVPLYLADIEAMASVEIDVAKLAQFVKEARLVGIPNLREIPSLPFL